MKAVGLKTKEVRRWVGVENGITVLFAIVCGVLLGLGLAALILPLTAITQEATVVTPPLEVVIPWPAVAGMTGIVLALLFAAGMIVTRMVKRLSLASLLRAGDD
jgi:ABC-type antimicrobial peptide transport system permease subunit